MPQLEGLPTVNEIVMDLKHLRSSLQKWGIEETDVRLRVYKGNWYLYSGDSSYDQDHRGFWGSSTLFYEDTEEFLSITANTLIDEVLEAYAGQN
jgi:hypothetical protein